MRVVLVVHNESMPREERLSAVAKRRRLNGDIPKSQDILPVASDRSTSPPASNEQRITPNDAVDSSDFASLSSTSATVKRDENTFSSLVHNDVVQFSGSREIERLNHEAIRIRLSKGQKCLVSGQYSLWVKEGVISLLGAKLESSTDVYTVYATELFETPAILSASATAEFEIRSLYFDMPTWSGFRCYEWVSRPNNEYFEATFFVHGYSLPVSNPAPKRYQELNTEGIDNANRKIRNLCGVKNAQSLPAVLVGGKRSSGADLQFLCVINHLLVDRNQRRKRRYSNGIVVLDLDWETPTFSPPGMACLVHVKQPLFGPAFVHVASAVSVPTTNNSRLRVLKTRHVAHQTGAEQQRSLSDFVDDCLRFLDDLMHQKYPLVVKAGRCLDHAALAHVVTALRKFSPICGLNFGSEHDSYQSPAADFVAAGLENNAVINVTMTFNKKHSVKVQHRLRLQSYFHSRAHFDHQAVWSSTPLELDPQKQVWLSYGRRSALVRAISHQMTQVDTLDTADILDQCIVAIVVGDSNDVVVERRSAESAVQGRQEARSRGVMVDTSAEARDLYPALPKAVNVAASANANVAAAGRHECLGLGIVAALDHDQQRICLLTPVCRETFEACTRRGDPICLIAQKADGEGRWETSWVQLELVVALQAKPLRGTIPWRPLHIKMAETWLA